MPDPVAKRPGSYSEIDVESEKVRPPPAARKPTPAPPAVPRPAPRAPATLPVLPDLEPLSEATATPRSGELVPPPTASPAELQAIDQAARSQGAKVVRPPAPVPLPKQEPPPFRWWHTAEGTSHVVSTTLKGFGALVGGTLAALATYRATAPTVPPPAPPPELACPEPKTPAELEKQPELCRRLFVFERRLRTAEWDAADAKKSATETRKLIGQPETDRIEGLPSNGSHGRSP